jgi:hypothetical protein
MYLDVFTALLAMDGNIDVVRRCVGRKQLELLKEVASA